MIEIGSKLSSEKLLSKLERNCDPENFIKNILFLNFSTAIAIGTEPIIGNFNVGKFRLRKRIYYQNAFQPCFYGMVISDGNASKIIGEFKLFTSVRIFNIFTIVFCFIFLVFSIYGKLHNPSMGFQFFLFPIGAIYFTFSLSKGGWEREKESIRDITEFLNRCADDESKT